MLESPVLGEPTPTDPRLRLLGLPLLRLLLAWLVGSAVSAVAGWLAYLAVVIAAFALADASLSDVASAAVLLVLVLGAALPGSMAAALLWSASPELARSTTPRQWAAVGLVPALVVVVLGFLLWRPFVGLDATRSAIVSVALLAAVLLGPLVARWWGGRSRARADRR